MRLVILVRRVSNNHPVDRARHMPVDVGHDSMGKMRHSVWHSLARKSRSSWCKEKLRHNRTHEHEDRPFHYFLSVLFIELDSEHEGIIRKN